MPHSGQLEAVCRGLFMGLVCPHLLWSLKERPVPCSLPAAGLWDWAGSALEAVVTSPWRGGGGWHGAWAARRPRKAGDRARPGIPALGWTPASWQRRLFQKVLKPHKVQRQVWRKESKGTVAR